jgi:hypothetical protein
MYSAATNLPASMRFEVFEEADLMNLPELQPPGWGDLVPRFRFFIWATFCFPIKITSQGRMIGIGASICHADSAWLACIVIHPEFRNQGLGTIITQKLMNDLDPGKYQTIFLDATYLGFPVYQKLGFETELEYLHFKTEKPLVIDLAEQFITDFRPEYQSQVLALDIIASGEDRQGTLLPFLQGSKVFITGNSLEGFFISDLSDGLIVASTRRAGLALMKFRLQARNFSIFPESNEMALSLVRELNFNHYRSSKRMRWGPPRAWEPSMLYNRISGQLG